MGRLPIRGRRMQATIASTDAERIPFWSALINDRRMAPALGLGFTSGMPFLLTYSTQSAWLTDAGVPLATIDDRPAQRTDPRLQVQVRLGAVSRSIRSAVDRTGARAPARLVD